MAVRKKVKTTEKSLVVAEKKFKISEKLKNPKFSIPLIIIVLAIVGFLFKGLFVAALVNGQPITRLSLIRELEKQGGKQTLSALVNQALILQEARKKNIDTDQKEVDSEAKKIEDSLKKQGQDLNSALLMQGLTREDFLRQLRLRTLVTKLLADQIKVADKEIADYMEKNKDTLPKNLKEDELKQQVKQQLEQQKLAGKSQEWLAGLMKNAKINYFVNY